MQVAGHESAAHLRGIVQISFLHNLVQPLFGVDGLAMARSSTGARAFLISGGAVYLVLWIYGLIVDMQSQTNFVPLDTADDWLHPFLGVVLVGLGFLLVVRRRTARGSRLGHAVGGVIR